jgi:transcriptional regulator with GAF, ATPase, and Fis domain
MSRRRELVALRGPLHGRVIEIAGERFTIGRDASSTLCLQDSAVSRRHCLLICGAGSVAIQDQSSANGTWLNGVRITEATLSSGDRFVIGDSEFLFYADVATIDEGEADIVGGRATSLPFTGDATVNLPSLVAGSGVAQGRAAGNLQTILRAAALLSAAPTSVVLGRELMESLSQAIPAERGALVPADEELATQYWSANGAAEPFRVPRAILGRMQTESLAICLNDVRTNADTSGTLAAAQITALMAVPLMLRDDRLGVIYLDTRDTNGRFDDEHLELLRAMSGIAAAPLARVLQVERLERENRRLEDQLGRRFDMVGDSAAMQEVYHFISRAAQIPSTVLIQGESGTGKELVARAIQRSGARANRPFVAINCAAITETLLESEFFGHEKGAFTGAVATKKGKLEAADGGVVFLDEIGEMALPLQAKLLRVLQEREFERVGGTRTIKVDIRVIAATNRRLEDMVERGTFRQDLYYRLNVVSVTVPPLRERREDIPLLAHHFLQRYGARAPRKVTGISKEARRCLTEHEWPGNVRELQNAIERAVVMGAAEEILPEDFPDSIVEATMPKAGGGHGPTGTLHDAIHDMKRQLVLNALERANGNHTDAARLLGIHPTNLYRLMRSLKLTGP